MTPDQKDEVTKRTDDRGAPAIREELLLNIRRTVINVGAIERGVNALADLQQEQDEKMRGYCDTVASLAVFTETVMETFSGISDRLRRLEEALDMPLPAATEGEPMPRDLVGASMAIPSSRWAPTLDAVLADNACLLPLSYVVLGPSKYQAELDRLVLAAGQVGAVIRFDCGLDADIDVVEIPELRGNIAPMSDTAREHLRSRMRTGGVKILVVELNKESFASSVKRDGIWARYLSASDVGDYLAILPSWVADFAPLRDVHERMLFEIRRARALGNHHDNEMIMVGVEGAQRQFTVVQFENGRIVFDSFTGAIVRPSENEVTDQPRSENFPTFEYHLIDADAKGG